MTHQQAIDGLASERYLLDEMSEMERHEFEAHYFDCAECAEDVRLGELIRQETRRAGATAAFPASASPAKVLTRPQWRRPAVLAPWAAAAALALVASYQSFVAVPALRDAMTSQAIAPVILRGATRGAAPAVKIVPGQRFVTLAADVMPESGANTLRYELLDSTGSRVTSGEAAVPPPGTPFMLLVPADELRAAGRYSLTLRNADGTSVGEYEFDVSY
jgi:anti-sigma factor RsiW